MRGRECVRKQQGGERENKRGRGKASERGKKRTRAKEKGRE